MTPDATQLPCAGLPMHLVTHSQQNSPAKRRHLQEFARAVQAPFLAIIERLNRSNEALLKSKHAAMASEKEIWTDRESLRAELAKANAVIEGCARIMRGQDVQDQGEAWDLTLRTLDAHLRESRNKATPETPAVTDGQIAEATRLFDEHGRNYFEDAPAAKKLHRNSNRS